MKKSIIILLALFTLACEKEEEPKKTYPRIQLESNCKCGDAEYLGGSWDTESGRQMTWRYEVRNYCTNKPIFITERNELRNKRYCKDYQW